MEAHSPKVSVIVPVYNVEQYLRQCLDSIVAQSLKDIEIICVNDGSPDHSREILEEYTARYTNVCIVDQENGGLSSARNHGLRVAKGEYIAFVDSDDFIAKDMMEKLYLRAEECNADIVVGDLYIYDHKTKETSDYRDQALYLFLKNKVFQLKDYPEFLKNIAAWDRLYRRDFLKQISAEFPVGLVYEDALFTAFTSSYAKRIAVVPEKFYYYRKNAGASITDKEVVNDKYKSDFLEINRRIQKHFASIQISQEIREEYLSYFLMNGFFHQKNATNYRFFCEFFQSMQELLLETDYPVIAEIPYRPVNRYGVWLQNDQVNKAYLYACLHRHFRRENNHVYFRFSRTGREFKLK